MGIGMESGGPPHGVADTYPALRRWIVRGGHPCCPRVRRGAVAAVPGIHDHTEWPREKAIPCLVSYLRGSTAVDPDGPGNAVSFPRVAGPFTFLAYRAHLFLRGFDRLYPSGMA